MSASSAARTVKTRPLWMHTLGLPAWAWLNQAVPGVRVGGAFEVPLPVGPVGPPPAELVSSGLAAQDGSISVSVASALLQAAHPLSQIRVRAWAGNRVVFAQWCVGVDSAVAMVRVERVDPDASGGPAVVGAGSGLRFGVIPGGSLLDSIMEALPPVLSQAQPPDRERQVRLPWPECTALLDALAATEAGFGCAVSPVAAAVQARFPGSAAPALLRDLAVGLKASCEIVVEAPSFVRMGSWLAGGSHVVALRAGGDAANDAALSDPSQISVDLVTVSGEEIRADMQHALAGSLDVALRGDVDAS